MNPTQVERWLPIPGYEGYYEVSDHGRVKSLSRPVHDTTGRTRILSERIRKPVIASHGYYAVGLAKSGKQEIRTVHSLVLESFVGSYPDEGKEIRHLDGDPLNNHLSNLRYGTSKENHADMTRHGTRFNSRKTHCSYGHEFADWNCYQNTKAEKGYRVCIACSRARSYRNYHKISESWHKKFSDAQYESLRDNAKEQNEQAA